MSVAEQRKLWWMIPTIASQERVDKLATRKKPQVGFVNDDELHEFRHGSPGTLPEARPDGIFLPVENWSAMPTPRLFVRTSDFQPNYFWLGLKLVSDHLARTVALGPEQVQYIEADCSECPTSVQDMGYKAINVLACANPIDRERSGPGRFVDIETPGGPTYAYVSNRQSPFDPVDRIYWREDFVPPAPLFCVPNSGWLLATEELAERVTRAGIDDVAFLDVTNDGTRTDKLISRDRG